MTRSEEKAWEYARGITGDKTIQKALVSAFIEGYHAHIDSWLKQER